jgi:hypothetical protein
MSFPQIYENYLNLKRFFMKIETRIKGEFES